MESEQRFGWLLLFVVACLVQPHIADMVLRTLQHEPVCVNEIGMMDYKGRDENGRPVVEHDKVEVCYE